MLLIISDSPGSVIASVHSLVFFRRCAQFSIVATAVVDTSLGQHGVVLFSDFLEAGQLLVRMIALPCLIIFRVCLYPSTYFPPSIAGWSLELADRLQWLFIFVASTIYLPEVWSGSQPRAGA